MYKILSLIYVFILFSTLSNAQSKTGMDDQTLKLFCQKWKMISMIAPEGTYPSEDATGYSWYKENGTVENKEGDYVYKFNWTYDATKKEITFLDDGVEMGKSILESLTNTTLRLNDKGIIWEFKRFEATVDNKK